MRILIRTARPDSVFLFCPTIRLFGRLVGLRRSLETLECARRITKRLLYRLKEGVFGLLGIDYRDGAVEVDVLARIVFKLLREGYFRGVSLAV